MTLMLSDADVRAVLSWRPAVDALRAAYATAGDGPRYPERSIARGNGTWLRVLPGVPGDGGLMGAKIIAAAPGAGRVSYLIALFDQATTQLVALIDGNTVTGYRTAATSALAADLLAVPGPLTVGMLGSGFEAGKHLRAIATIREITGVRVYSPRAASRERFARELADLRVPVALLRAGKYDAATEIYWQLHPARKVKASLAGAMHGGFFLNRQAWKFQGWLQGYNGGPLRMPTQRIHDHQMAALRKGLLDAGLAPSMDPFREFFTGRNPA